MTPITKGHSDVLTPEAADSNVGRTDGMNQVVNIDDASGLNDIAYRMGILLSGLTTTDRRAARLELVSQVTDWLTNSLNARSLYPADSVVGREIARIARMLFIVFRKVDVSRHTVLWGDFSMAVGTCIAEIEFTAEWVIKEISGS